MAMHHPIFSGDTHHVGSPVMNNLYDEVTKAANRTPHMVLAGHVHNYQRFTLPTDKGEIPFIVAGAGGYYHLHGVAHKPGKGKKRKAIRSPHSNAVLVAYEDKLYGFLQMTVSPTQISGKYVTTDGRVVDKFTLAIDTRKVT